jgi:hypothetical protein
MHLVRRAHLRLAMRLVRRARHRMDMDLLVQYRPLRRCSQRRHLAPVVKSSRVQ